MCATRIFRAEAVTHSPHIRSTVAGRTKVAASSDPGWRLHEEPVPQQIVSGACNQPGTRRRPGGAEENFPSEILQRSASGAPLVDPDQRGLYSELHEDFQETPLQRSGC